MDRDHVFPELRSRGAVTARVEFSGGNDEGGADYISLRDRDDNEVASLDPGLRIPQTWDSNTRTWRQDRDPTLDEALVEALEKPIYDTYGGFAGDFSVSGTVVWDIRDRTVKMHKSESEYVDSVLDF